jgi:hypothetical protein
MGLKCWKDITLLKVLSDILLLVRKIGWMANGNRVLCLGPVFQS